ncbi:hypothetical protein A5N82_02600 [Christensenella minuta]|uniref:Uncharacterized protein n=1 Tax=Christensenella minuta TaxID=626937 RepID=A0A136Q3R1_9FIRM|nr:hypothetical protein B1H56_05685 [Christensenella minuta]KXK65315.1 hypothetical protein HMPREF3293_01905 [Christensenella minuta]OAQ43267.1 hypothetical protein A5N82_02600 [Christensenella minuta]
MPAAPFLRFWDHKQTGAGAGITSDCKKISGGKAGTLSTGYFFAGMQGHLSRTRHVYGGE